MTHRPERCVRRVHDRQGQQDAHRVLGLDDLRRADKTRTSVIRGRIQQGLLGLYSNINNMKMDLGRSQGTVKGARYRFGL